MMKSAYTAYIISAFLALTTASESYAQLKESVDVEGQYEKEILHPDKLGYLPDRLRLYAPESDLNYTYKGVPAEFIPSGAAAPATSYGAFRGKPFPRGYLELSAGSWLNSSLKAGYAIIESPERSLSIWLRHNSTSLWKPFSDNGDDRRRFNYQEAIGAEWTSRIKGFARLEAGMKYHLGYFNYYGVDAGSSPANSSYYKDAPFPTQTLNDFSLRLGLKDIEPQYSRNHWNAAADMRHFAFRTATRETSIRVSGGYKYLLNPDPADISRPVSAIGIDGDFRWLLYGAHSSMPTPEDYGNLRVSPSYRWSNSRVSLHIGFNADLTFNAGSADYFKPDSHYSLFHISPDVRFDVTGSRFAAWIHATGGQELQTLASIAGENLYCLPALQSTTPLYIPVDAQAGLRFNPFGGAEIEARIGYRISRNVRGDGWTIPLMDSPQEGIWMLPAAPAGYIPTLGLGCARYDLKGFYAGAAVRYKYGKYIEAEADLQYSPQSASKGIYNGCDRPRWILTPAIDIHPVEALTIGVAYQYRGVRNVWSAVIPDNEIAGMYRASQGGTSIGSGGVSLNKPGTALNPVALRLPDITRLNARATYTFKDLGSLSSLTLGIEATNLLNRRETLLPGLPSEGIAVCGSVGILF